MTLVKYISKHERVDKNLIYNSPSNSLQINTLFRIYFQKYDRSRRHSSSISPSMKGLTKILSTTLLQIVCKFLRHSEFIFKSMTGPDDTRQVDLQA